ncbi:STAS-like domain-containing protein [Thalassospiraceae bacterium SW-3-3]|nr:STAS-like domain-containing protein [Thalassospiraceae bacterium SW-3-3]
MVRVLFFLGDSISACWNAKFSNSLNFMLKDIVERCLIWMEKCEYLNFESSLKKKSRKDQLRAANLARRRWQRRLRRTLIKATRRRGSSSRTPLPPVYIEAPSVFSLTKNYEQSVRCLKYLKDAVFDKRRSFGRRGSIFLDLATIEELHPAAAVVLAAELHRWQEVKGIKLRPRRVAHWKPAVLQLVTDMGMFDLLELQHQSLEKIDVTDSGNVALRVISDRQNDKERTDKLSEELMAKVPVFANKLSYKDDMALSAALAEASLNSVTHAYEHTELLYPCQKGRWWAAAVYEQNRSVVKFFVYDQGVGIPATLPKTQKGKALLGLFFGRRSEYPTGFANDSKLIRIALRGGISATRKEYRGNGFPQMVEAISNVGGRLRVISGKGSVSYDKDSGPQEGRNQILASWWYTFGVDISHEWDEGLMMIHIADDFSPYPSGREKSDGPNSGERFRDDFLVPALQENDVVEIVLDGVKGYPSSFTEEAFGGLIRLGFNKEELLGGKLLVVFHDSAYRGYADDIIHYIKDAQPGG